jgi:hypothetical protein
MKRTLNNFEFADRMVYEDSMYLRVVRLKLD